MSVKQISVFLENRPGALKGMTEVLAENRIDMRALSLAETTDFGIARLIVDDVLETATVLKDAGFVSSMTPVVAAAIPDETGGLDSLLGILSEAGVNIEYMYAFLGGSSGHAYMIFRVEDARKAEAAFRSKGVKCLSQEEISAL